MSDNWKKSQDFIWEVSDSVTLKKVYQNIRKNTKLISKWMCKAYCHKKPAIFVSAGPSINFHKLKKIIKKNQNADIFCVKHSLPLLIKNGIEPDYCMIVDPQTIYEKSSWGIDRISLLEKIPSKTTFIIVSRSNPEYVEYLLTKTNKIVGLHLKTEFMSCFNIDDEYIKNHINLFKILNFDLECSILHYSCAANTALAISYFLGYRDFHFFGLDGNIDYNQELLKKIEENPSLYRRIKTNDNADKIFYTTTELLRMVTDMDIFFNKTHNLNITSKMYGKSIIYDIWKMSENNSIKLLDFNEIKDNMHDYLEVDTSNFSMIVNNIKKNRTHLIFNQPYNQKDYIIRPIIAYKKYLEYQQIKDNDKPLQTSNQEILISIVNIAINDFKNKEANNIICHGCGTNLEQNIFKQIFNCDVIGTDLNPDYIGKDDIIQWDFHHIKKSWINKIDIIFSNSFDHSYDLDYCLQQWSKCLSINGIMIIEWNIFHKVEYINNSTPCKIEKEKLQEILENKFKLYLIQNVIPTPNTNEYERSFFFCKKKSNIN